MPVNALRNAILRALGRTNASSSPEDATAPRREESAIYRAEALEPRLLLSAEFLSGIGENQRDRSDDRKDYLDSWYAATGVSTPKIHLPGFEIAQALSGPPVTDADGTSLRVKIIGAGKATVAQVGDDFGLTITGTNAGSVVTIYATGGDHEATLRKLEVHGALKSFNAADIDLKGDAVFHKDVSSVTFGNIDNATLTLLGKGKAVDIRADDISGLVLRSSAVIDSFKADRWTNAGAAPSLLQTTVLNRLDIDGAFAANVVIIGKGGGHALGAVTIDGVASGAWVVNGNAEFIGVKSTTHEWRFSINGDLGKLATSGTLRGEFAARNVERIFIGGDLDHAQLRLGARLGTDGVLGGTGAAADRFSSGKVDTIAIAGSVTGSRVWVGVDPGDGIYDNGNDVIVGRHSSRIQSLTIGGVLAADSYFVAGRFPLHVFIDGHFRRSSLVPQLSTQPLNLSTRPVVTAALANDTGSSSTDGKTRDAQIAGRVQSTGAITSLRASFGTDSASFFDIGDLVQADGSFALNSARLAEVNGGELPDGDYTLRLVATNRGGTSETAAVSFSLDTTAPAAPIVDLSVGSDTGSSTTDDVTRDATPTFDVSAEQGSSVQVSRDGVAIGAPLSGSGAITVAQLSDGTYEFSAVATDSAGNASATGGVTVTIDTAAPSVAAQLASDTGSSGADGVTANPAVTGLASGGAVALRASFSDDAATFVDVTDTLQANGAFVLDTARLTALNSGTLPDGSYALRIVASDAAGNVSAATTVPFTLDTSPPAISFSLAPESDTAPVGDDETAAAVVDIVGTTSAGASVELLAFGVTAIADSAGLFRFEDIALALGANALTVRAADAAGNTSQASRTFTRVGGDTDAPTLIAALANDTGASSTDGVTNDPAISGSVSDAVGVVSLRAGFGTDIAAFANVTDALAPDGTFLLSAPRLATINGGTLQDGAYTLRIVAADAAGNTSDAAEVSFTLDTTPPAAPAFALAPESDSAPAGDGATTEGTVSLVGVTSPGASVSLVGRSSVVVADASGAFRFDDVALAIGANVFTTRATDVAGNSSQFSTSITRLEVDSVAPVVAAALVADTGDSAIDGITNDPRIAGTVTDASPIASLRAGFGADPAYVDISDLLQAGGAFALSAARLTALNGGSLADGSYTLRIIARDAEGNESAPIAVAFTLDTAAPDAPAFALAPEFDTDPTGDNETTAAAVSLVGATSAGARVELVGRATTTADGTGAFRFDNVALAVGANALTTRATDVAGNLSQFTATITRASDGGTDSAAPVITAALVNDAGLSASDGITNDARIAGTVTDASAVASLRAGFGSDPAAYAEIISAVQADGSFTLDVAALAALNGGSLPDGAYVLRLVATDAVGNASAPFAVSFTLDTVAPPVSGFGLAASSDTGAVGDNVTAAGRVTLTGTAELGAALRLGTTVVSAGAGGLFQIPDVALNDGANAFTLSATDVAGNVTQTTLTVTREGTVSADVVVSWNFQALEAIRTRNLEPTVATRVLALVGLAQYDTLAAIEGTPAYMVKQGAPGPVSTELALAKAAHAVLSELFPARVSVFDAQLAHVLDAVADGDAKTNALSLGQSIADAVLALREHDGSDAFIMYNGSNDVGKWRPTEPMYLVAQTPEWSQMTPFALTSADQFRRVAPPALDSAAYAENVNEIQALGSVNSTVRTAEQTQTAHFWADGGGSYTPPGHWNQIAQQIAQSQGNSLGANVRLFAQLNVALADAAIAAWDTKFTYHLWRPVDAIHNADLDGNEATTKDGSWTPLLITPPHPEYVSGHSTFSSAAATVLTSAFGSAVSFSTTSYALPGVTRTFQNFWQAAEEAGRSRIYGGIHYTFSNEAGKALGTLVGETTLARFALTEDTQGPVVIVEPLPSATNRNITISGQIVDNLSGVAAATFSVDGGEPQPLVLDANGKFAFDTQLSTDGTADGSHSISISAVDTAGNVSETLTRTILLDTRPPTVSLESIEDGAVISAQTQLTGAASGTGTALVALSYRIDDSVARTLVADASGRFDERIVLGDLSIGDHAIAISATDAAGNTTTITRMVTLPALARFVVDRLTPTDGSDEVGVTYRPQVTFSRAVNASTLTSDSFYASGPDGSKIDTTIVPSLDGTYAWLFFNNPLPGAAEIRIHVNGAAIRAAQDGAFLDADGDGVAGGSLVTSYRTVSTTAVPGTRLIGKIVDPGPDLEPMSFDDIRRGPDGVIHTADDVFLNPIVHAKVYVIGREAEFVYTDAQGNFELTNVPVGNAKVVIDGRTATNAPSDVFWPEMVMDVNFKPGVANTLMGSMGSRELQAANASRLEAYLPRIRTSSLQEVSSTEQTTVTVDAASAPELTALERQSLTLTVAPGAAIGKDGQALTDVRIGINTVPAELVKDMLPPGVLQHSFDITIQAPGVATFADPVQITFPNIFNAAPGTKLSILSFDHETGRLVINGTGTVSADGLTVVSDPGAGVRAPGWHGMAPPGDEQDNDVGDGDDPKDGDRDEDGEPDQDEDDEDDDEEDKNYRVSLSIDFTIPAGGFSVTPFAQVTLPDPIGERRIETVFDWPESDLTRTWNVGSYDFSVPALMEWALPDHKEVTLFNVNGALDITAAVGLDLKFRFGSLLNTIAYTGTAGATIDATLSASITGGLIDWLPEAAKNWLSGPWEYEIPTIVLAGIKLPGRSLALPFAIPDFLKNVNFATTAQVGVDFGASLRITPKITLDRLGGSSERMGFTFTSTTPKQVAAAFMQSLMQTEGISTSRGFGSDPRAYYRYQLADGSEISGVSDSSGKFSVFLPANSDYTLAIYRPSTNAWEVQSGTTSASGQRSTEERTLGQIGGVDEDSDGIPDIGEYVLGTRPDIRDTDGDGITDSAELAQGSDPLGGLSAPIGVLSSAALQGTAEDVAVVSSSAEAGLTALVATGSAGLAVVDASRSSMPIVLAELDLNGSNVDVAADAGRGIAAVAASEAGLHLVDISNRSAPRLLETVSFGSPVTGVAVRDGFAYAIAGSRLTTVDLNTAEVRETLDLASLGGGTLLDVAIEGDTLFLLDASRTLRAVSISGSVLTPRGAITLAASSGKLFVGGGTAYVAGGNGFAGGFSTVDVRDPANLVLASGVDANNLGGTDIAANGSGLAVVVGNPGGAFGSNVLDVVNVSDPADTGTFITRITLPAAPKAVAIANGLAFVADGTAGLQVVNYAGFDTNGIAPSVEIVAEGVDVDPATPGVQVLEGRTVRVVPTISDDVQIRNVELLVNDVVVSNDVSFPWELFAQVPTLAAAGEVLTLQVRVTDTGGNISLSNLVTLDVVPDTFAPQVTAVGIEDGARRFFVRSIDVTFDEPLDVERLDVGGVSLVRAGADEQFGTPDDELISVRLDTRGFSQTLSVVMDGLLPPGDYRFTIDPSIISDRAGNLLADPIVRTFSIRPASDVKAASGVPEIPTAPAANPGQQIGVAVPFDPTTTRAQFSTIDASGNRSTTTVNVTRWDAARGIAYFNVPTNAVTGDTVVYSQVGTVRTDFPDGTFPLQIVPVVTGAVIQSINPSAGTVTVLVSGFGFVEGSASEYRFGVGEFGEIVVDASNTTGPDVQNRTVTGIGTVANGQVSVTLPLTDGIFGPISVKTDGGVSSSFTANLASVEATAFSGTPADAAVASANPGQAVTLRGTGLSTTTSVLVRFTDFNGSAAAVQINPAVASTDGTSATLILPLEVNGVARLQVLGSASQPLLQIVPVLNSYQASGSSLLLQGAGFVEAGTRFDFAGGVSYDDTTVGGAADISSYFDSTTGRSVSSGLAQVFYGAVPRFGFGNATVTTAGGTSAPIFLSVLQPGTTAPIGAVADVAADAAGALWVVDQLSPGHLLRVDQNSGEVLQMIGLSAAEFGTSFTSSYAGLHVLSTAMTLNGVNVPAGSLLFATGAVAAPIAAVDPQTGSVIARLNLQQTLYPTSVAYDSVSGNLWMTSYQLNQLVEVDPQTGALVSSHQVPFNVQTYGALAIDPTDGGFWVGGSGNVLVKLDRTGAELDRLNLTSYGLNPGAVTGLAFATDGTLRVAPYFGDIHRVDLAQDLSVARATLSQVVAFSVQGVPANGGVPSANVGQVIELVGTNFGAATQVLFNTRDNAGNVSVAAATPLAINATGTRLQVQVPGLATTGDIRVVNYGAHNLGFSSGNDGIHRQITRTFTATGSSAVVRFTDGGLDSLEGWGIDNVVVRQGATVVFEDDFEGGANAAWSDPTTDRSERGPFSEFSGRFANTSQSLNLTGLTAGQTYTLTFDLYAIEGWDGNSTSQGPDVFDVSVDGASILRETVSNMLGQAQTLNASVGIRLQVVPTLTGLSGTGRPGDDSQFTLLGTGFMEGASTVTIGGVALVDAATNNTPFDVTGTTNGSMTVVAPRTLDGPIRITTEGGYAEIPAAAFGGQLITAFTGITATAASGTPGNVALASANTGQAIVLTGQGFTSSTLVQFQGVDDTGRLGTLTRTGAASSDGKTLTVVVPALARTGAVTVLGSNASFHLQVVPTLRAVGGAVGVGNVLLVEGTGLTRSDIAIQVDGRGVGTFNVQTVVDGTGTNRDQQILRITLPAGVTSGAITVSTAGGSASIRRNAAFVVDPTLQPADDIGETLGTAQPLALLADHQVAVQASAGDGAQTTRDVDVYRVDVVAGDTLSFAMSGFAGRVRIFDATGTQLANQAFVAAGTTAPLRWVAPVGGTYYIGVSASGNGSYDPNVAGSGAVGAVGTYSLAVERLSVGTSHIAGIAAIALSGTPAVSNAASANALQTITLSGSGLLATDRVVFTTVNDAGELGEVVVTPSAIDVVNQTMTVAVPSTATTGRVRLERDQAGLLLQIVPTLTDVQMNAGSPLTGGTLTLTGTSFVDGAMSVSFGGERLVDVSRTSGLAVSSSGTRATATLPGALPTGPIRVTTVGGTSAAFGVSLASIATGATTGVPANGAQASANPGQPITLIGTNFDTTLDVVFQTIDVNGGRSDVIVRPSTVSSDGTQAQVIVPLNAVTGTVRIVGDTTNSAIALQVIPIVTGVDVTSVTATSVTLTLTGVGFVEDANSEYRFGLDASGIVLLDAGNTTGPDVQNRSVSGVGTILNGQVSVTLPLSDGIFGPITVRTTGGTSAAYTVSLASIEATALSGTPANPALPSANPGQSVTLRGTGLSTSTSLVVRYTDYNGAPATLELNPAIASSDGTSAMLLLPHELNGVVRLQVFGSSSQPLLQIVPVLRDYQATNAQLGLYGAGFVEGNTRFDFTGSSYTDTQIADATDVSYYFDAVLGQWIYSGFVSVAPNAVARFGFGSMSVTTAGGTSAPLALNVIRPGTDTVAVGPVADLAVDASGMIWVANTASPGHLLRVDPSDGEVVQSIALTLADFGTTATSWYGGLHVLAQAMTLNGVNVPAGSVLYTTGQQVAPVVAFNPQTGAVLARLNLQQILFPTSVAYDAVGGHLWMTSYQLNRLVEVDPQTGGLLASYPVPMSVQSYAGLAIDPTDGNFWVGGSGNVLVKFDRAGVEVDRIDLTTRGINPGAVNGLSFAADGTLRVAAYTGEIHRIDLAASSQVVAATLTQVLGASVQGVAANGAVASANVGQVIELVGTNFGTLTQVLFNTRDNAGNIGVAAAVPLAINANGTRLQVQVPGLAATGEIRVVNPGSSESAGRRLQVVPTLAGLTGTHLGGDGVFNLIGSGFMEGASTITIGGVEYVDAANNLTPFDVTGVRNDAMSVVAPLALDGPVRITTEGGYAEIAAAIAPQPLAAFSAINASAASGTPPDSSVASANTGQTITLVGQGLTSSTLVQFQGMDDTGHLGVLTRTGTASADGRTLTVVVPVLARSGAVTLLGSNTSIQLQVVPTIRSVGGALAAGNVVVVEGTGFSSPDLEVRVDGQLVQASLRTVNDGTGAPQRHQQLLTFTVPAGVTAGAITLATSGGAAVFRSGTAPQTDASIVPAADVGDTLTAAQTLSLAADRQVTITATLGDGAQTTRDVDLYRVDLGASDTLSLAMSGFAGRIRVLDSAGLQLATQTFAANGATAALRWLAPAAGTYYIGVSGSGNSGYDPNVEGSGVASTTGPYALTVERLGAFTTRLSALSVTAASGVPTHSGIASANTGQTIVATGIGLVTGDRLVFTVISDAGVLNEIAVSTAVDVAAQTLTATIPATATTGRVRLERDQAGLLLQIVPTLSDVQMSAGGTFTGANLILSGSGFAQAAHSISFGSQTIVDSSRSFGPSVTSSSTRITLTVPNGLPTGPVRVTTVGGTSAAFGVALTGVEAAAVTGTPANAAQASANPGQTIVLNGANFDDTTDVLFETIDAAGTRGQVIVKPASVAAGGAQVNVVVPFNAVTGSVRVVGDINGAAIPLQIVPQIASVELQSVSANGTAVLVITGFGFIEDGASEYAIGSVTLVDTSVSAGPDVGARFVTGIGSIANGQVTVTVQITDELFGPITVRTAGGASATFTTNLTGIDSVAASGTPANPSVDSANAGQLITLEGTSLTATSAIALSYLDYAGQRTFVRLLPTSVATDGTSATVRLPDDVNGIVRLQMIGSSTQPLLQIVPTLTEFEDNGPTLVFRGSGLVEGATVYAMPGTSYDDTSIADSVDVSFYFDSTRGVWIYNGAASLPIGVMPRYGTGSATVSTAGGTSAPLAIPQFRPGFATTSMTLGDLAIDRSSGTVWVAAETSLNRVDPTTGAVLQSVPLTVADFGTALSGDYAGLQVLPTAMTLNGVNVPAGSLLFTNGAGSPTRFVAVDPLTGNVIASRTTPLQYLATAGVYDPTTGHLFIISYNFGALVEIDPATGAEIARFSLPITNLIRTGIALDPDGESLWVGSALNQLVEISKTGTEIRRVTYANTSVDRSPSGLAFDADGSLVVATSYGFVFRTTV